MEMGVNRNNENDPSSEKVHIGRGTGSRPIMRRSTLKNSLRKNALNTQKTATESENGASSGEKTSKISRVLAFNLSFLSSNNKRGSNHGGGIGNGIIGGGKKMKKNAALAESKDIHDDGVEEDPVVALFQARTTQRVRFSLEGITSGGASVNSGGNSSDYHQQPQTKHYEKFTSCDSNDDDNNGDTGLRTGDAGAGGASGSSNANKSIRSFMKRALFSNVSSSNNVGGRMSRRSSKGGEDSSSSNDDFDAVVAKEIEKAMKSGDPDMVWGGTNAKTATTLAMQEVTVGGRKIKADSTLTGASTFVEKEETRAQVIKLLNKATRAQYVHFRYEYAVKCCVRGMYDYIDVHNPHL